VGAPGAARVRVDRELVRRGLVASREEARLAVAGNRVQVDGAPVRRVSTLVRPDQHLIVGGPPPRFVSRGGEKLVHALDVFAALGIDPVGRRVLDAGMSTGGFTDCLLQAGATAVVGVDVGYGQVAERLRRDPRVTVLERTHVRDLDPTRIGAPFDALVADLSFISLASALPHLLPLVADDGWAVVLVKPQFEVGREAVGRGGVVRDPEGWRVALERCARAAATEGWTLAAVEPSPLRGPAGNVEFLALLRPGARDVADPIAPAVAAAAAAAAAGEVAPPGPRPATPEGEPPGTRS
jgi:23S rRNA (cytidine1920-2'-O)/16S rRNA (cytidine1409-2'-O)-methyltransferase